MSTNRRGIIRVKSYKKPNTTNETTPQPEIRATKNKNTPAPGEYEGINKSNDVDSIVPQNLDRGFFEKQLNGVYAVVVQIKATDGFRVRRNAYFSLAAAQRAVDRARMNGHQADIVLAQLRVIPGGIGALWAGDAQ